MMRSSVITDILTVTGFRTPTCPPPLPDAPPPVATETVLSVGLVLDGERTVWGDCAGTGIEPAAAAKTIERVVAPLLQGQPVTGFRRLMGPLANLTETVMESRPLPEPERPAQDRALSRRALLTGRIGERARSSTPATEEVAVERPLHPAIRYGLSQALLAAVAAARNRTVADVVAETYDLPRPATAVPLHLEIGDTPLSRVAPELRRHAASLGYRLPPDLAGALGNDGEILQRHLRDLKDQVAGIVANEAYRPLIHVDLRGGLGELFANSTGKILGALYGLEQAVAPYPLRVEDPLRLDDLPAQLEQMQQLHSYMRLRRMTTQLATGTRVTSAEGIRSLVEADGVDAVRLDPSSLGGLDRTIDAILSCRQHDRPVVLAGAAETDLSARLLCQVALVTQPDLLGAAVGTERGAGAALVYNELVRGLARPATRDQDTVT